MNRADFCILMSQAKQEAGVSTSELSFAMKMLLPTLRRFEKGTHNFNLKKALEYLSVINYGLLLESEQKKVLITCYDELIAWMIEARQNIFSQRQLAEKIGAAHLTIANIERKATTVSIDTFLKIVDVLGYVIKIEKIE